MSRNQFRAKRIIAVVPVVAGQPVTVDLPRGYDLESLYLRLYGGLQVTAAATSVRAEAPAQAIARVEVVADGRNTLYSAPFWFAVFDGHERRKLENGARATTPPTAVGIATYQVEALGTIDFATVDGERPKDSNLKTNGFQLFQLRMQFGNAGDSFVGGTVVYSSMFVEIYSYEMIEIPDAAGQVSIPSSLKKVTYQEFTIPGSNANLEQRLPAGNHIKSLFVRTEGATTAGEPSTAVLNEITAFAGLDVRAKLTAGAVRGSNNSDFGYVLPGHYILDFARSGSNYARLSELWDVTQQAEPKVGMNVTGGASVKAQIVITEYIGLAKPSA